MLQNWSNFWPQVPKDFRTNRSLPQTSFIAWGRVSFLPFFQLPIDFSAVKLLFNYFSLITWKIFLMPLKRQLPKKLGFCMSNLGTKCSDSDFSSLLVWLWSVDITCSSECFIYTVASFFQTGWFWNKYLSWIFKIADYIFKIKFNYISQWNAWQVPWLRVTIWQTSLGRDCNNEQ